MGLFFATKPGSPASSISWRNPKAHCFLHSFCPLQGPLDLNQLPSASLSSPHLTKLIFPSSKHRLHHLPPTYLLRPGWERLPEGRLCHALQVATLQGSIKIAGEPLKGDKQVPEQYVKYGHIAGKFPSIYTEKEETGRCLFFTRVMVVISGQRAGFGVVFSLLFRLAIFLNSSMCVSKGKKAHISVTDSTAVIPFLSHCVTSEHAASRVPHLRSPTSLPL